MRQEFRTEKFKLDLPMIFSVGTAYSGFENLVVALDVRYFDYRTPTASTPKGLDRMVRYASGLGASNIMAVAAGAQLRVTDALHVRGGYTYNQSIFQDGEATIGVLAPLYYQHQLACGASLQISPSVWLNLAYAYYPEDSLTGQILTPVGPVPGSTVTTTESVHDFSLGVTVRY